MPDGLGVEEDAVQQDGHHADEFELPLRIDRPRFGQRLIRQDQRDGRHREQHAEIEIGAGDLDVLFAITQVADENADTDKAVVGEDGIARASVAT
jgi:hypothetical protein